MKILILSILSFITLAAPAQQGVDDFLQLVEQNNQELQAARKLADAEKAGFQTGLTPDNPTIEYGHFPGSNDAMGTKTIYGISQSFDFPTVYAIRKKLATNRGELSNFEYQIFRQDKLLEAKLKFYDYLFLLKQKAEYESRLEHSTQLYQSYQAKFEQGNTSVLDVNKARIQNLKIKSNYQLLLQAIESTRQELELLAGNELTSQKQTLLAEQDLPPLATLIEEVQDQQPELRYLKQAQKIAAMNVKLARNNWLPNLEISYEGEQDPDGTYRGIKAGIAIPLWKDKNKVEHAQAQALYETNRYEARITAILNESTKLYRQATEFDKIRKEYKQTLKEAANVRFLDKALLMGQMSVIDYFNELAFYYETMDSYLEIEKNYYRSLAQLQAFRL
ncbi:TolC family protein [Sunxiuqinia sp. sy24]|uniref:TolC family protein n=1 Tax=Sunxiuqinia sp. sy24 TaxID=3461495 RepID=UPI0040464CEB